MKLPDRTSLHIHLLGLIVCWVLCSGFHWWDPLARWMGIGNDALENGDTDRAAEAYDRAAEGKPGDPRIHYNRGLLKAMEKEPEKALEQFEIAARSDDPDVKAGALYNQGCLQMMGGDPEAAVESFTKTLKLQPDDEDAKVNLEMALQMLQQMPSPTPQSNPQDSQDDQEQDDQEQQEQEQQEQEQQEQQQPEQDRDGQPTPTPTATGSPEAQPQSEPGDEATPTPQTTASPMPQPQAVETPEPVEEGKMSRAEAERLLDAQEDEEMEVLKRFHQLPPVKDRDIEKDW